MNDVASPTYTLDSPRALARATNANIGSNNNKECEQTFIGSCIAVKFGVTTFFGTVTSCFMGPRNRKIWHIQHDNGVDQEEVTIVELT